MTVIQRLIAFLCPLALFLVGGVKLARILLQRFGPESWRLWLETQFQAVPPISVYAGWALLFLLPLFLFLFTLQRWRAGRRKVLSLKTEGEQPIKILDQAVNRYVQDDLLLLPYLRKARVASSVSNGELSITAYVQLLIDGDMEDVEPRLRQRIGDNLRKGLGITHLKKVDVIIESVQIRKNEAKRRMESSEKDGSSAAALPLHPPREAPTPEPSFSPFSMQANEEETEKPIEENLPEDKAEKKGLRGLFGGTKSEPGKKDEEKEDGEEENGEESKGKETS